MKKRSLLLALIMMLLSFNLTIISGCGTAGEAVSYVNLSFNPNMEFVLDTANRVVSVNAINDDGELLFASEDFEGQRMQTVMNKIMESASKSGLFNIEDTNNVIYLNVVNEDSEYANDLFEKVKGVCDNFCKTNGIYALALSGQLPEEIVTLATEYNLPPGHIRLILKALELNPDLTIDELVTMPIVDVVKIINENFKNFGKICVNELKEDYKAERLTLKVAYENSVKTLFGAEYTTLLDELALLESQIDVVEGVALDNLKIAIESKNQEINTLRLTMQTTYNAEFNALKEQYQLDKQVLINTYVASCAQTRATLKTNLQARINSNVAAFEQKQEYAKNRNNNFGNKYENWKNLKLTDIFNFLRIKLEENDNISLEIKADLANAILEAEKYYKLYQ